MAKWNSYLVRGETTSGAVYTSAFVAQSDALAVDAFREKWAGYYFVEIMLSTDSDSKLRRVA